MTITPWTHWWQRWYNITSKPMTVDLNCLSEMMVSLSIICLLLLPSITFSKIFIGKISEDKILTRPPSYFEEDYINGVSIPQTLQSLYKRFGEIQTDHQDQHRRERLLRQPAEGLIERTLVQPFKTEGNVKVSFVIWIPITVGTPQGRWEEHWIINFLVEWYNQDLIWAKDFYQYKFRPPMHCQAQIDIWHLPDVHLTFTWRSPDHLTILWPSPDPHPTLT